MSDNLEPLNETKPSNRGPWRLIAAVVIVTLIAIWLVPTSDRDATPTSGQGEAPSLLQPPVSAGGPAGSEGVPGPGGKARKIIADLRRSPNPDLDQAFQMAEAFRLEGKLTDAHLLYFYAAREGHGPAAMVLARQADPATHESSDSLLAAADVLQANKWYSRALAAGIAEAEEPLRALRDTIEQAADNGDQAARRIMLQWK